MVIYEMSCSHVMFLICLNSSASDKSSFLKQLTHDSKFEGLNPAVSVAGTRHCETNLNVCFEVLEHSQLKSHHPKLATLLF